MMRWLPNYVPLTLYTHTEIDQLVFETSTQKFHNPKNDKHKE